MDLPLGLAPMRPQTEKILVIRILVWPEGPSFHKLQTPFHEEAISPPETLSCLPDLHQSTTIPQSLNPTSLVME